MYNHLKSDQLWEEIFQLKRENTVGEELGEKILAAIEAAGRIAKELTALKQGARAVLEQKGFEKAARAIFDHCKGLIGAQSGYVALLNEMGEENEVLFLEAGGLSCTVDPELPMPIRGLRARAYKENRAVYDNAFMKSDWVKFLPKGHVALKNVLFAPLVIDEKTVGLIGLANKPSDFDEKDAEIATSFGSLAAIALQNSKNLDEREKSDRARDSLIVELKEALEKVKTLRGMLPICSHCKKIRDDKGYWNQIESYVRKYSEAEFSHSICPECAKAHYPDLGIYEKRQRRYK